jgi:hypothetical protein
MDLNPDFDEQAQNQSNAWNELNRNKTKRSRMLTFFRSIISLKELSKTSGLLHR